MKFIAAILTIVFCANSVFAQEAIPSGGINFDESVVFTEKEIENRARKTVLNLIEQYENTPSQTLRKFAEREELCDVFICGDIGENEANSRLNTYLSIRLENQVEADRKSDNEHRNRNTKMAMWSLILSGLAFVFAIRSPLIRFGSKINSARAGN